MAIEKLVSNPRLAAEMGYKARTHVEQFYSAQVVGNMMTDLYLRAVAEGKTKKARQHSNVVRSAGTGVNR